MLIRALRYDRYIYVQHASVLLCEVRASMHTCTRTCMRTHESMSMMMIAMMISFSVMMMMMISFLPSLATTSPHESIDVIDHHTISMSSIIIRSLSCGVRQPRLQDHRKHSPSAASATAPATRRRRRSRRTHQHNHLHKYSRMMHTWHWWSIHTGDHQHGWSISTAP